MFYTGLYPLTMEPVYTATDLREKRLMKALLFWWDQASWPLAREALKKAGREDLIGRAAHCLVPPEHGVAWPGKKAAGARPRAPAPETRAASAALAASPRDSTSAGTIHRCNSARWRKPGKARPPSRRRRPRRYCSGLADVEPIAATGARPEEAGLRPRLRPCVLAGEGLDGPPVRASSPPATGVGAEPPPLPGVSPFCPTVSIRGSFVP